MDVRGNGACWGNEIEMWLERLQVAAGRWGEESRGIIMWIVFRNLVFN